LYRWFVDCRRTIRLGPDHLHQEPERLQNGDVFTKFMTRLLNHSQVKSLLSDEHFSVDGTLIEAWASQKSFRPKDGSGDDDDGANFHGQKRQERQLMRVPAIRTAGFIARRPDERPSFAIWVTPTMENRHGLAVAGRVTHANGTRRTPGFGDHAEGETQSRRPARITAGEDKAYDTADHVANLRAIGVTPHVTQNQAVTKTGKTRKQRHRRTNHAASGIRHVAITPGDGRVHLRMGASSMALCARPNIVASLASPPTSCSI